MSQNERENRDIEAASPALAACLSELGRRVAFPPDIPFQAAQARGTTFNATIGQITDSTGRVLSLPSIEARLDLDNGERNRAQLYSPVEGHRQLRRKWRAWQRREAADQPSSLPIVTVGLTHGLSLVADLFAGPGRPVAVPSPFWGNYRQTFSTRAGATLVSAPAYVDGRFDPRSVERALVDEGGSGPALAIVNAPSNPGGYTPDADERAALVASLVAVARRRELMVVCDDAYAGLVYEEGLPRRSIFWDLVGVHSDLVPVKVDGATKEFDLFGGRVGFLTFAVEPESAAAAALESKVKCLTRATVGSPVSLSQVLLEGALSTPGIESEVESIRRTLEGRYRVLREALERLDRELLTPLPFNSGCFALLELRPETGLDSESVRRHLLESEETGLISIAPRYLRIAFCSVGEEALPELVRRIESGVRHLAATRSGAATSGS